MLYRDRQLRDLSCPVPPIVGYVDYSEINRSRRKQNQRSHYPGRHPDYNYNGRLSKITPKDWLKDPYLLCMLISIAQSQYRYEDSTLASAYKVCRKLLPSLDSYTTNNCSHAFSSQISQIPNSSIFSKLQLHLNFLVPLLGLAVTPGDLLGPSLSARGLRSGHTKISYRDL